ncbi:MAG: hybrid sensor histidine kinase/response regulator [Elusimicrobia bacterium]|nr:hybrid sensor histidine kinase/response regulator [Elusimicrobiota bacterium]
MNEPMNTKTMPSILMVDDTPANLELLTGMLKERGYSVRAAVSGKLALQAARNEPPDLVLLAINMPGMDGYEVCAELKADEKLKEIPVIFLSALNETMDKVKAFRSGGLDYITKPFQFEEVEARVKIHLELLRQKRQLQENYDELSRLEKLRDTLVHMVIHDLRTPLTVIGGFLELIKDDRQNSLTKKSGHYIIEARNAADQIAQIVSDVLDASKMEGGQMKLKLEDCDLAGAVKDNISALQALAESRVIRFAAPESPVVVLADRDIIFRVIQNLLANALKFTADGGTIQADIAPAGGRMRVSVHDNGPGIAPQYRQRIFDKFAQVELPAGRQKHSTGLGLTFCKLAVEAHGGSIGVDSVEGKGSTFWFELPANGRARSPG